MCVCGCGCVGVHRCTYIIYMIEILFISHCILLLVLTLAWHSWSLVTIGWLDTSTLAKTAVLAIAHYTGYVLVPYFM